MEKECFLIPEISMFKRGFSFDLYIDEYVQDVSGWYSFTYKVDYSKPLPFLKKLISEGKIRYKKNRAN